MTDTLTAYAYSASDHLLTSIYTGSAVSLLKYQPAGEQRENLVVFTQNVANQEMTVRMVGAQGPVLVRDSGSISLHGEVKSVERAVTGQIYEGQRHFCR